MQLNQRKDPLEIVVPPGGKGFVETFLTLGHFKPRFDIQVFELADGQRREYDGYSITAAALAHPVPTIGFRFDEGAKPGRFDREKALSLGVPEGELWGRLQRGDPIMAGGRKVYPQDVMGPPRPGHSFAYLTDTGPTPRAVEIAKDADVLVMEATADDSLTDYANQYGHCAASQTARTALEAGAKDLFIVHLSARYKEPEPILSQARAVFPNTRVPPDLTEVEYPWS
jgi:ribonuclease Z